MANFKVGDKVTIPARPSLGVCTIDDIAGDGFSGTMYYINTPVGLQKESERNLRAANSRAINDKWIDDFHVIVTSGKPDASLLSALKEKATAWKLSKKNFSDRAAADRHNAAESKVYDIARRLGAKVVRQGAVMKVVMPNSRACNSSNPVVRKALNAVACNSSLDDALAEADRNKYDSVVLFQKVIGSGTLFPDKFKLDGGYDCENAVRAAVKTGKYNEAIFYKNGSLKKRIRLNSAWTDYVGSQKAPAKFKVGDRVLLKHGGADWGTIKLVAGKMHGVQKYRVTWDHNGEDVVFEDDLVTSQKDVR